MFIVLFLQITEISLFLVFETFQLINEVKLIISEYHVETLI